MVFFKQQIMLLDYVPVSLKPSTVKRSINQSTIIKVQLQNKTH